MRWNLRLAAASRGIWKASELQRSLAEHGLVISAGKMSGLWSGKPASIKLDDLDVICAVLGCGPEELLIPEPAKVQRPTEASDEAANAAPPAAQPKRQSGRSLPPAGRSSSSESADWFGSSSRSPSPRRMAASGLGAVLTWRRRSSVPGQRRPTVARR